MTMKHSVTAHILSLATLVQSAEDPTTKHVLLSFQLVDGKFVPVIQNSDYQQLISSSAIDGDEAKDSNAVVAAVFLIIMFTVTLVSSTMIIGTIGSSLTLRR